MHLAPVLARIGRASLAAVFLSLSVAALGCDADEASRSSLDRDDGAVTYRNFSTGKPWGPCKGGMHGQCEAGSFCRTDVDDHSSICTPACLGGCPAIPIGLCGFAPECNDAGACVVVCADDGDCMVGQKCGETGICAWPAP